MLSTQDFQYLKRNGRAFKMSREEILEAFESKLIPPHETFVSYQQTFGGYRPDPERVYGIVGRGEFDDADRNLVRSNGVDRVRCADDSETQMPLCLDSSGVVYYHDQRIAETFESYLRYKRYVDCDLQQLNWTFIDDQRRSTKRFQLFLEGQSAKTVSEATDSYHAVRLGKDLFWIEISGGKRLFVRPDTLRNMK